MGPADSPLVFESLRYGLNVTRQETYRDESESNALGAVALIVSLTGYNAHRVDNHYVRSCVVLGHVAAATFKENIDR